LFCRKLPGSPAAMDMEPEQKFQGLSRTNSTLLPLIPSDESASSSGGEEISGSDAEEQPFPSGLRSRTAKEEQASSTMQANPALPAVLKKHNWAARGKTLLAMLCLWSFAPILVFVVLSNGCNITFAEAPLKKAARPKRSS